VRAAAPFRGCTTTSHAVLIFTAFSLTPPAANHYLLDSGGSGLAFWWSAAVMVASTVLASGLVPLGGHDACALVKSPKWRLARIAAAAMNTCLQSPAYERRCSPATMPAPWW
jgi:hypothetical protein